MKFLAQITRGSFVSIYILSGLTLHGAENRAIITSSEWATYRGNISGTGYSPLDQITLDNVNDLEVAWSYSLRNDSSDQSWQASRGCPQGLDQRAPS